MVFSHGLGGTSSTYSQLVGSLSSHGIVVVAPEHRDGSAPITYTRDEAGRLQSPIKYRHISHNPTPDVLDARAEQLKIRLWEIGLFYDLLGRLAAGQAVTNLNKSSSDLTMFKSMLDIYCPGDMTWAGHSFGAASMVQFVKSNFYRPESSNDATYKPLYIPRQDSELSRQITPKSVVALLDIWTLSLTHEGTRWLLEKPLPCYSDTEKSSDTSVVTILSEGFYKWHANLKRTKEILSPKGHRNLHTPHLFYAESSAHFSQSDFGVLFPWLTRFAFKAKDPERILRLNVRAILEVMRRNGKEVADTSNADLESTKQEPVPAGDSPSTGTKRETPLGQDPEILRRDGSIGGWIALELDKEAQSGEGLNKTTSEAANPMDAVMDGEVSRSSEL